MGRTCTRCAHVNPLEARYCYHDGSALMEVEPAASGFARPFVFPSGRTCRDFDQLALACQQEWEAARELLQQGGFEAFLAGMGRADLSLAAREAARFPDPDRGLDQFLSRLPSQAVPPPRLHLAETAVELGSMELSEDRTFSLRLVNAGQRVLYGTVRAEANWLSLGSRPGRPVQLFQCSRQHELRVNVLGSRLRAGARPLEGRLAIESNGGSAVVTVRVLVRPRPFPSGVLAGACSPRELAERALAQPRAAAELFARGEVARWYRSNGWSWPVRGPTASGLAALQQFFEALGLARPPRVEISERSITLSGVPGGEVRHLLQVRTLEKRPVYAQADSSQPWLEVGRPLCQGRAVGIPLVVSRVPDRPGETLHGRVRVRANGNQQFVVPVYLRVERQPFANLVGGADPGGTRVPLPDLARRFAAPRRNFLAAALLGLSLAGIVIWDALTPVQDEGEEETGTFPISQRQPWWERPDDDRDIDPRPRLLVRFSEEKARFGLVLADERDPNNRAKFKRLTYQEDGGNNNCCVKIDNHEYLFGQAPGFWVRDERGQPMKLLVLSANRRWKSAMEWPEQVRVTRLVRLVADDQSRRLDTCLVVYQIHNRSPLRRTVGLREMLDTYIGGNDGVPFAVPNQAMVDTVREFAQKDIPDYIQALERPDLKDPGTVAHLGLRLPRLEVPLRLVLCHWPDEIGSEVRWAWRYRPMNEPPQNRDSCVAIYWAELDMAPGEIRHVGYTYGLGRTSDAEVEKVEQGESDPSGRLSLTVGGSTRPGEIFTAMAYVRAPQPGQSVLLRPPPGLSLPPGQPAELPVPVEPGRDLVQVAWKVRADAAGRHRLVAHLRQAGTTRATAVRLVRVPSRSVFG